MLLDAINRISNHHWILLKNHAAIDLENTVQKHCELSYSNKKNLNNTRYDYYICAYEFLLVWISLECSANNCIVSFNFVFILAKFISFERQ